MLLICVCLTFGRTGTKASNLYRIYSNAFMEGRPHEIGCGYMRSGIPSIQSTASARPSGSTPASLASWARTHHLSKSAPPMERQEPLPPQPKQHASFNNSKGPVLAAAERILQRVRGTTCSSCPPAGPLRQGVVCSRTWNQSWQAGNSTI